MCFGSKIELKSAFKKDSYKEVKKVLQNSTVQWLLGGGLILFAIMLMFTPDISNLKRLSNYTVYFMLAYLAVAMTFFVLDQKRLMLFSFLGCGMLCIYLKGSGNQNMRLTEETSLPKMSISLINLSLVEDGPFKTIMNIKAANSDAILVQELTPDWDNLLIDSLVGLYPYQHLMVGIDQYGMGLFSKYPIFDVDTFEFNKIPNLYFQIGWDEEQPLHVICSIMQPPVSDEAFKAIDAHFGVITEYIKNLEGPLIAMGNYNRAPWTTELTGFKSRAKLNDSRRDATARSATGSVSMSLMPEDHIFFNNLLACIAFNEVSNSNYTHLGVLGTYQIKPKLENEKAPLID